MESNARKLVVRQLQVFEMTEPSNKVAIKIRLPNGDFYSICLKRHEMPDTSKAYNTYPLLIRKDGVPWDEANLYLLNSLEESYRVNMTTVHSKADDLLAFLRFLESKSNCDWRQFPKYKFARPTYLFRSQLGRDVEANLIASTTARRRMNAVINFYRWLIAENLLVPENAPWTETEHSLSATDPYGGRRAIKVKSTDLKLHIRRQDDPYDARILDGGRLRPLPRSEQEWIIEALDALGNTEMTLNHLFSLTSGARIQTALTMRVKHILNLKLKMRDFVPLAVGLGTGIDTKFEKQMVLQLPSWLVERLQIYAISERARNRRIRAVGGDTENQYLFLSERGNPFYMSKDDEFYMDARPARYMKRGQGVRQYINEFILPYVRSKYASDFTYQFHDLRATFGMNLVDSYSDDLNNGRLTYEQVLELVRVRMGHSSRVTTERYLQYKVVQKLARQQQDGWEVYLKNMADRSMEAR